MLAGGLSSDYMIQVACQQRCCWVHQLMVQADAIWIDSKCAEICRFFQISGAGQPKRFVCVAFNLSQTSAV